MRRFMTRPVRRLCALTAALVLSGGGYLAASAGVPATAGGSNPGPAVTRAVTGAPVTGASATGDPGNRDRDTGQSPEGCVDPGATTPPTPGMTLAPKPGLTTAPKPRLTTAPTPGPTDPTGPVPDCWAWIWP